jgi:hypothetical protein
MGQKVPPGLVKRGGVWHVQKTISGKRIRESTGTSDLTEAERYLAYRMEETRKTEVYGVRQKDFREATSASERGNQVNSVRTSGNSTFDPYIGTFLRLSHGDPSMFTSVSTRI